MGSRWRDTVAAPRRSDPEAGGFPVFEGAAQVIKLIGYLYQRLRYGDRPRELSLSGAGWRELSDRRERSGRGGLPMVCLVRPEGHDELLGALAARLAHSTPNRVPHAFISLAEILDSDGHDPDAVPLTHEDIEIIRNILVRMESGLAKSVNRKAGRFRFRLFSLVNWLMDQQLGEDAMKRESRLRRLLRRRDITARIDDALTTAGKEAPELPSWLRWIFAVLRLLLPLLFVVTVTSRVTWLSGQYRWFLRQPHLSPEVPGGFLGFAERLTKGEWIKEDPEQVARFLTNAFLEDLRRAYRWRPWQLLRVRRTTYATLLLDNITRANGGYVLLKLINDVRNETGRFDPLLVISASRKVPPDAGRNTQRPKYDARHALGSYREWQNSLLADRRARRNTAWYLPLRIPGVPKPEERSQAEQELDPLGAYKVPRQSLSSSRLLRLAAVAVLLVGAAYSYRTWSVSHCGEGTRWPGLQPSLTWTGSECIGVTDGSYNIFQPSDPLLAQVVSTILNQNQQAERLRKKYPQRPYITLIEVEALTSSTGTADGLTAERESLEGVAVAQWRQLNKNPNSDTDPIVRILIANAGKSMKQGVLVAQQLKALAVRDPSLVGVVGLDMSSQPTMDTITALTNAGLPMVAATLSADSLAQSHQMYFQVAPQNLRQAAVAAAFAKQHVNEHPYLANSVRVYYADDEKDTYSVNLRKDVLDAFNVQGFLVEAKAFTPNDTGSRPVREKLGDTLIGNASVAGRDTCRYNGFAYFAGRGVPDFGAFLDGAALCGSNAVLLGDDDVTRYVADANARRQRRAMQFYYESFAPAPTDNTQPAERDFYSNFYDLFSFERDAQNGRSLDGHAALSYDATLTMITAAKYLREKETIPITPGTVWREITDIHTSHGGQPPANNSIDGVTGVIDFGGDVTQHVPFGKPVAILSVDGGEVNSNLVGFCGNAKDHLQSSWCPPDR